MLRTSSGPFASFQPGHTRCALEVRRTVTRAREQVPGSLWACAAGASGPCWWSPGGLTAPGLSQCRGTTLRSEGTAASSSFCQQPSTHNSAHDGPGLEIADSKVIMASWLLVDSFTHWRAVYQHRCCLGVENTARWIPADGGHLAGTQRLRCTLLQGPGMWGSQEPSLESRVLVGKQGQGLPGSPSRAPFQGACEVPEARGVVVSLGNMETCRE